MKRRGLTDSELALWRRVTTDVAPIGGNTLSELPQRRSFKREEPPFVAPANTRPSKQQDIFASGDPRLDRRTGRGHITIDAQLDLHGHTLSTAEATLYGFLRDARSKNFRCILVITGKGRNNPLAMPYDTPRGVLHRQVRTWINNEPFRQHISRAAKAHQRHGGDGAIYIFLKTGGDARHRKVRP